MLEGPTALLTLSLAISSSISFSVTGDKNKLSRIGDDMNSLADWEELRIEHARLVPILEKILSALASGFGSTISRLSITILFTF